MGQSGWSDSGRSVFVGPPSWDGCRSTCGSWPEAWSSGSVGRDGADREVAVRWSGSVPGRRGRARAGRGRSAAGGRGGGAPPAVGGGARRGRGGGAGAGGLEREIVGVIRAAGSAGRKR